jgi:hypothetical protein
MASRCLERRSHPWERYAPSSDFSTERPLNPASTRNTLALAVAALLAACGGRASSGQPSGASASPPPAGQSVIVVTSPPQVELAPGGSASFAASVTGTADTSVKWSVAEVGGGTVDASGLYTAPAVEGVFHVRAGSSAMPGVGGVSVVTVRKAAAGQGVAVAVSPASAALDACGKATFAASITGAATTSANWSVIEAGGGTVANGVYSAPRAPGTYHVVATSTVDPSRFATATVVVGAEKVLSVAFDQASATVTPGGTLAFGALVTTSCGTFASR